MRRSLALLSAVLLAGAVAACGPVDTKPSAQSRPTAPTSTASATPATPETGKALFASMAQQMAAKKTAKATFDAGVAGQQVTGTGAFRFGTDFAATLTMATPGQGDISVVLLPGTFYLKLPKDAGLPAGKSWVKISKGDSGPLAQSLAPALEQMSSGFDPKDSLRYLEAASSIKSAGTETLDGVQTTKYVTTVDVARLVAAAQGTQKQQYQAMLDAGQKTLTATTWVGADQLPRKFSTTIDSPQGPVTASGTYSDWGAPVDIQEPPAAQVVAATELRG